MNMRTLKSTVLAVGIAATPMLGVAAGAPPAVDSCVKAFMASLSSKSATTPKLRESHYVDSGGALARPNELELTARDAYDNHTVARAVCTVNAQSEVIDLHDEPVDGVALL